jgi:hypothetical protein
MTRGISSPAGVGDIRCKLMLNQSKSNLWLCGDYTIIWFGQRKNKLYPVFSPLKRTLAISQGIDSLAG